jgi:hypothetical protein
VFLPSFFFVLFAGFVVSWLHLFLSI